MNNMCRCNTLAGGDRLLTEGGNLSRSVYSSLWCHPWDIQYWLYSVIFSWYRTIRIRLISHTIFQDACSLYWPSLPSQLHSTYTIYNTSTDYEMINVSITLTNIEHPNCTASFFIMATDDDLIEAEEQFTVTLTSSNFIVTVSNSSLLVTIENDNDNNSKCMNNRHILWCYVCKFFVFMRELNYFIHHVALALGFQQSSYTVEEGDGLIACVTYSGGTLSGVVATFTVSTEDGTATDAGVG